MPMPLIMLGSSYNRQSLGAAWDYFQDVPADYDWSANQPGSSGWADTIKTIVETGGDLTKFFLASKQRAITPEQKAAVDNAAKAHGITLSELSPYLIGGAALLVVLVLLMSRKRR